MQNVILLVAGQDEDIAFLKTAFEEWGVINPLQIVTDGTRAIDYLTGAHIYADRSKYPLPKLMLLGLELPRFSSFEVLKWIRAHRELNQLPIVILAGPENHREIELAYQLGANSYLLKTAHIDQFWHSITELNQFVLAIHHPTAAIQFRASPPPRTAP